MLDADALVAAGEDLYQLNCASCHGPDLTGDQRWKEPLEDGSFRPPPHDESGHTWHHSDELLLRIVRDGSDFANSAMPAYSAILSDREILSILEFIKSTWGPDERQFQRDRSEDASRSAG